MSVLKETKFEKIVTEVDRFYYLKTDSDQLNRFVTKLDVSSSDSNQFTNLFDEAWELPDVMQKQLKEGEWGNVY